MSNQLWTSDAMNDADPTTLLRAAESMIVARRALQTSLPVDFLHDPALDILLALFVTPAEGPAATTEAIIAATTIPPGVAQRWIGVLAQEGLVIADGTIALTASGRARVTDAIKAVIRSQADLHAGN